MKSDDLKQYRLLAEGGQSKIYDYDQTKILRVPKREMDYDRIKYEYQVYKRIEDKIPVPKVYDIINIDNKPCLIMEKISGKDMYSQLKKRPFRLFTLPNTLANLHTDLFSVHISDDFMTNHQKAKFCIGHSSELKEEIKEKLLTRLQSLSDGSILCHGDFHPGNIIESDKKSFIIDWSSATIGSPLFDIAHTYLLLINTPQLDNVSDKEFIIQQKITGYIGRKYLKKVCKLNKIQIDSIFPYILIKAGERSFYGMNSEKKWLSTFIENTIDKDHIKVLKIKKYA